MSGAWLPPRLGRAAIVAACCAGATSPALAHPHIFIDATAELLFAGRTLAAVRHTWRFDEAFSAFASQGLDKNGDRVLTETELAPLAKTNVAALEAYIREQSLRQEIRLLRIEIDESRRQKQVSEIVDTDFFQELQTKARTLRQRRVS